MDQEKRDLIRAAAYEATRNDLRGSQASKTSRRVTCTPPNTKCGGRCIPPNWDCRLKGQGTNRELKVHGQDISAGIASTQRGVGNIVKGVATLNPERFERGRKAVIRGVVKIAPGDNLEAKKRLRQKLEKNTALIAGVAGLSLLAAAGYAKGRGRLSPDARRMVEQPAINAFNRVQDQIPFLGARRERNRIAGGAAAGSISSSITSGIDQRTAREAAGLNTRSMGPLGNLGERRKVPVDQGGGFRMPRAIDDGNASKLHNTLTKLNNDTRNNQGSFEDWRSKSVEVLFGAKTSKGKSIYTEPATNEFLVNQYGLDKGILRQGTDSAKRDSVKAGIVNKLRSMGEDFESDRKTRGIVSKEAYLNDVVMPQVKRDLGKRANPGTLDRAEDIARQAIFSNQETRKRWVNKQIRGVDSEYDDYFDTVASRMKRNAAASDSPLGDGYTSLARYAWGTAGKTPNLVSRSHSELMLREYYNSQVMKLPQWTTSDASAIRVAQQLTNTTSKMSAGDAFKVLKSNGMPRVEPARARPTGRQQSLSELARSIRGRSGNENMSMAAALRQAKAEMDRRNRGDAMPPRVATYLVVREDLRGKSQGRGKPCGNSHIPKAHECNKGKNQPSSGSNRTAALTAAVGVAAIGGSAAIAARDPKVRQRARVEAKLLLKGSDKAVRQGLITGGRGVVAGLSTERVKQGLDKLPSAFQSQARQLVGKAKAAAAGMSLKAEGFTLQGIDVANNFSTWKDKKGSLVSVGSYGDSLVTYVSSSSHKWNGKQVYKVGFDVDQDYDANRRMPDSQSRSLTNGVKKMNANHLSMIGDGVLATVPWGGDKFGSKRRAIYKRVGYNNIAGEDSQWALVEKGRIKKMSEAEAFVYLADSGEREAPMYKPSKRR